MDPTPCAHCGGYGGMLCGSSWTDGRSEMWVRCYRCSADTNTDGTLRALAPVGWGGCCCNVDPARCDMHRSYV